MTSPNFIAFILLICLYACYFANGSGRRGIRMQCTQMDDDESEVNSWGGRGGIQYARGKKGPKGDRGERGQAGASPEVNYQRIYDVINERIERAVAQINRKINDVDRKIEQMNQQCVKKNELRTMVLQIQVLCPVQHSGHCFWVVIQSTTLDAAEEICARDNGLPANIYSERHLTDIMAEVRTKMTKNTIYIWTGMNVHLTTGAVSMRNGTPAPYIKWWDSSTFPQPNEAGLYIYVKSDANSAAQGMGNDPPGKSRDGVICEY